MPVFQKSTRKNAKYMVFYDNKWIHFGDKRYEQYKDTTPLKLYSNINHLDKQRRKNYLLRAKGIRDKHGNLTWNDKSSPNYWSVHYLW